MNPQKITRAVLGIAIAVGTASFTAGAKGISPTTAAPISSAVPKYRQAHAIITIAFYVFHQVATTSIIISQTIA